MQDVNVLVVFESRGEGIERLAYSAAVGAVEARANIRLRCLHNPAGDTEFVAPRASDAAWAEAILAGGDGLEKYFDSAGALGGKVGAVFAEPASPSMQTAMRRAGLSFMEMIAEPDALTAARLQGRRVAEAVRSRRNPKN